MKTRIEEVFAKGRLVVCCEHRFSNAGQHLPYEQVLQAVVWGTWPFDMGDAWDPLPQVFPRKVRRRRLR